MDKSKIQSFEAKLKSMGFKPVAELKAASEKIDWFGGELRLTLATVEDVDKALAKLSLVRSEFKDLPSSPAYYCLSSHTLGKDVGTLVLREWTPMGNSGRNDFALTYCRPALYPYDQHKQSRSDTSLRLVSMKQLTLKCESLEIRVEIKNPGPDPVLISRSDIRIDLVEKVIRDDHGEHRWEGGFSFDPAISCIALAKGESIVVPIIPTADSMNTFRKELVPGEYTLRIRIGRTKSTCNYDYYLKAPLEIEKQLDISE